jgi:hypothetical protein
MATRLEMLKQAGFSDAEIGDWATAERDHLLDRGFTGDEIDAAIGVTRPPNDAPEAFVERMKRGNAMQRIAGAAADYAGRYFGDAPLGFSERNQEVLRRLGVVGDIAIPAAKPVDAALRAVPAGIAGAGAGVGQALEEAENALFGPGEQAKGKTARDLAELATITALLSGASRSGPSPVRAPTSRTAAAPITAAPAIVLPRAEDFRNAAATISGTSASFPVEQKLLRLWTEHGIAPAEVAQDAVRDRAIAAELLSESEKLPEAYTGGVRATVAAPGERDAHAEKGPASRPAAAAEGSPAATSAEERLSPQPETPGLEAPGLETPGLEALEPEGRGRGMPGLGVPGLETTESGAPAQPRIAESRAIAMFAPPRTTPQRPFRFDYRRTPATDTAGRLLEDMEGRPLDARFVVGRRIAGQGDTALTPAEMKAALTDLDVRLVESPRLPLPDEASAGVFAGEMVGNRPVGDMFVKSTLSAEDQNLTIAHEFGHAIDHYANYFSDRLTDAEIGELRKVYPITRAGPRRTPVPQPEDFGYEPHKINGELAAEGFRAYLMNPNWFKAVAPRSAAKFRAAVNNNRWLKHVIQFNSLGAAGLAGAGLGGGDRDRT